MEHAFVPSKNDLRETTIENIVKNIENQKIYDETNSKRTLMKRQLCSNSSL